MVVGVLLGLVDGDEEVGSVVGFKEGDIVGLIDGEKLGFNDGDSLGFFDGENEGDMLDTLLGLAVACSGAAYIPPEYINNK